MHKETIEQIARLRSRTAESETSYNKLKEQLAANDNECTTSQLRLGTNFLSDVEGFFIRTVQKEETPPRTVAQEAYIYECEIHA